jgi:hypothetical protein
MKGVYSMDRGTGALPLAPIAPATSRARATPPPPPPPAAAALGSPPGGAAFDARCSGTDGRVARLRSIA